MNMLSHEALFWQDRIPGDDRPSLLLRKPEDLPVVQATVIEHVMPEQPQPCASLPSITSAMNFIELS
jgi:hypothetical protein